MKKATSHLGLIIRHDLAKVGLSMSDIAIERAPCAARWYAKLRTAEDSLSISDARYLAAKAGYTRQQAIEIFFPSLPD